MMMMMMACKTILIVIDFIVFKHVKWSCFFFEQVDFCINYLYFCLFFYRSLWRIYHQELVLSSNLIMDMR